MEGRTGCHLHASRAWLTKPSINYIQQGTAQSNAPLPAPHPPPPPPPKNRQEQSKRHSVKTTLHFWVILPLTEGSIGAGALCLRSLRKGDTETSKWPLRHSDKPSWWRHNVSLRGAARSTACLETRLRHCLRSSCLRSSTRSHMEPLRPCLCLTDTRAPPKPTEPTHNYRTHSLTRSPRSLDGDRARIDVRPACTTTLLLRAYKRDTR